MTVSIEEVRTSSTNLANKLDKASDVSAVLMRSAGRAFLELLSGVEDKESAAVTAYSIGRLMAEVSNEMMHDPEMKPTASTIGAYGMSLVYAANKLSN